MKNISEMSATEYQRFARKMEKRYAAHIPWEKLLGRHIESEAEFDFSRALEHKRRARFMKGDFSQPHDLRDFRRFVRLTQVEFAKALCLSVYRLRKWERGSPSLSRSIWNLLSIGARSPRMLRNGQLTYDARRIVDWKPKNPPRKFPS